MEALLELNEAKEKCRVRLERMKNRCVLLKSVIVKHPNHFPGTGVMEELSAIVEDVMFF